MLYFALQKESMDFTTEGTKFTEIPDTFFVYFVTFVVTGKIRIRQPANCSA